MQPIKCKYLNFELEIARYYARSHWSIVSVFSYGCDVLDFRPFLRKLLQKQWNPLFPCLHSVIQTLDSLHNCIEFSEPPSIVF